MGRGAGAAGGPRRSGGAPAVARRGASGRIPAWLAAARPGRGPVPACGSVRAPRRSVPLLLALGLSWAGFAGGPGAGGAATRGESAIGPTAAGGVSAPAIAVSGASGARGVSAPAADSGVSAYAVAAYGISAGGVSAPAIAVSGASGARGISAPVADGGVSIQTVAASGASAGGGFSAHAVVAYGISDSGVSAPAVAVSWVSGAGGVSAQREDAGERFHDAHFHTTNYIQSEIALPAFLEIMGDRVGRAALMGIPLQQKWDAFLSGDRAPDYYLRSDAALYYYGFVDAMTAEAWRALPAADRARFDPMIVGFNPTDMYATDHIRRVLRLYPGVFSGIGEFSVHKEMVTAKTAGHAASLRNPALGRILDFAAEVGLVVSLHNDVDVILPRAGERPTYFDDFAALVRAHPGAPVLWAHAGIGRFVEPTPGYADLIESLLGDESLSHLYFDLSWDLVAEQLIADEDSLAAWARLLNGWPTRFVFGSDAVIPADREGYLSTFRAFAPLWERLDPEASRLVRLGNYERLFDEARRRVRAWEAAQATGR